jgi:hypothetical protein
MTMESPVSSRSRLRGLAVAALVAGLFATPLASVSAQDDETFEYDEGGVAYSVAYDGGLWEASSESAVDVLLTSSDSGAVVTFVTDPLLGDDVDSCLEGVLMNFEEGAGFEGATDGDTPGAGSGDGYVYETREAERDGIDVTTLHTCFDLGDGALLWSAALILDEGGYEPVYDLLSGVEGDGTTYDLEFTGGSTGGTDQDATPEADDATPTSGGDLVTYESPNYGYTFDLDTSLWTDSEEGGSATRDQFRVTNDDESLVMFVEGSNEWADTDECVAVLTEEIGIDPDIDTVATDPESGDDFLISEDDRSAAAYVGEDDASGAVVYIDCYVSPENDVIVGFTVVSTDVTEDEFFEDVSPEIERVIDSLEFASNAV